MISRACTIVSVFVLILAAYLTNVYFIDDSVKLLADGSSVHCVGQNHTQRRCYFTNLCLHRNSSKYIFLHGPRTSISGFDPKQRFDPALLDLSSVDDHNAQYFSYTDVPAVFLESKTFEKVVFMSQAVLIFNRFNPSNLMHIFHDDLLPLYSTIMAECRGSISTSYGHACLVLFVNDEHPKTSYDFLYRKLFDVVFKNDLPDDSLICFHKAIVGLDKRSTWYQYGFKVPQGPLLKTNGVTGREMRGFSAFIAKKLHIEVRGSEYAVLIVRAYNRKILNAERLVREINDVAEIPVKMVTLEGDLKEIIGTISGASILISVHGSALILSMFLKPGSIIIELFPFGVKAERYAPYKTLANIINLSYFSWENVFENNTVTHPDWPREHGGLMHLLPDDRNRILNSSEVSVHLCCDDPEWLFRIYQDTYVDLRSFSLILKSAVRGRHDEPVIGDDEIMFCGEIDGISCEYVVMADGMYLCSNWTKPFNLGYFNPHDVVYEVLTQEVDSQKVEAYFVKQRRVCFSPYKELHSVYVWIRCVINDVPGPFNAIAKMCSK